MSRLLTGRRAGTTVTLLGLACLLAVGRTPLVGSPAEQGQAVIAKPSAYTAQAWKTSSEFPKDYIQKQWDDARYITALAYGDGVWAIVMSRGTGYAFQTWQTSAAFPKDSIHKYGEDGYRITSLAYGDGVWAVVMSKGSSYGDQAWLTSAKFPQDFIKEYWDDGYQITGLARGAGLWTVVMSKGSCYALQAYMATGEFPKDFIQEHWDDDDDITSIAYGSGQWAVVMSKQAYGGELVWRPYLGVQVVDVSGGKGARVTDVVNGSAAAKAGIRKDDVIVGIGAASVTDSRSLTESIRKCPIGEATDLVLMRENEKIELRVEMAGRPDNERGGYATQHWQTSKEFPENFIDERWDDGDHITGVAYGQGVWAVVTSEPSADAGAEVGPRVKAPTRVPSFPTFPYKSK